VSGFLSFDRIAAWGSWLRFLTKGSGLLQGFTLIAPKQAVSTTTLHPSPTTTATTTMVVPTQAAA